MAKTKFCKQGHRFDPETTSLGYGYDATLSEGSVKPPAFLTSTFQFQSARDGKRFFELVYGLREADEGEEPGLIYSRVNNPNLQILEERMTLWDDTEVGAAFASGMAAISTTMLALTQPGDVVIAAEPVYGGTHLFLHQVIKKWGINVIFVPAGPDAPEAMRQIVEQVGAAKVRAIYFETPANPSIVQTDIAEAAQVVAEVREAGGADCHLIVDNTFMGPVFQRPAHHGADLVLYSATKFIGGHSDVVAGMVTGRADLMKSIVTMRTVLGSGASPFTGWLLLRSLETLGVRMRAQAETAGRLAQVLAAHPRVQRVCYPGLLKPGDPVYDIWKKQCLGPGSLISFVVGGGEAGAFKVLDALEVPKLAVSLGGTESLVEHPMSMTHADVPPEHLDRLGVSAGLVRISVGLERFEDLERDLLQALER